MVNLDKLRDENEDIRRWEIINISQAACSDAADILLEIFEDETSANKRHIVRAFGNIGGERLENRLLELGESERGLILGDIYKSLGQLRSSKAVGMLKKHQQHELQWVSQNARWALNNIESHL